MYFCIGDCNAIPDFILAYFDFQVVGGIRRGIVVEEEVREARAGAPAAVQVSI
jgi:hypothetical protein